MGLPGSGKTTLSELLAKRINAVHFNADEIRTHVNKDLGFSREDRMEHARRMGVLCEIVDRAGCHVIADMVCPLREMRMVLNATFVIWCDTILAGRYEDTNRMFEPPTNPNIRVPVFGSMPYWADAAAEKILGNRK
jgi:adenylylsulfate kinase